MAAYWRIAPQLPRNCWRLRGRPAHCTATSTTTTCSTSRRAAGSIDPKRLLGERGFDYANLFCNPESAGAGAQGGAQAALVVARFDRRLQLVTERSGLERRRLLQWIAAWCGLSAAWWMGDGVTPEADLRVAELALAALDP